MGEVFGGEKPPKDDAGREDGEDTKSQDDGLVAVARLETDVLRQPGACAVRVHAGTMAGIVEISSEHVVHKLSQEATNQRVSEPD